LKYSVIGCFKTCLRKLGRLSSISEKANGSLFSLGSDDFVIVVDNYDKIDELLAIAEKINVNFPDL
jgi:hypothetical protein